MRKAIPLLIFLLLGSQLLAAEQIYAVSYEKHYIILINGEKALEFVLYPPDNGTAIFNQISPYASAYEVQAGSFMQFSVNDVAFTIYFNEFKASYAILALDSGGANVKIADPTQVQQDVQQPNENLTSIESRINDLEEQINALQSQIDQLTQQIANVKAGGGMTAEDVNKLINPKIQQLQSDINSLEGQIETLAQAIAEIKKKQEKSRLWNDPVLQQLAGNDPKIMLMMTLFDPSASDEEKQQALSMYLIQQEQAKKRMIIYIVLSITIIVLVVGVVAWLKLRRERMSPYKFPRPSM